MDWGHLRSDHGFGLAPNISATSALSSASSGGVGGEYGEDAVADVAENGENFFFGAGGVSGVCEGPVVAVDLSGKYGARLICIAAHRDDGLDLPVEEEVHVFAGVG